MLLETEGFEVLTAGSHDEAIEHVAAHGRMPDLLISDYHLREDETGIDVIRALRERVRTVVPAILVSGDTSDTGLAHGLEHITFLTKPVDIDALLSTIRMAMNSLRRA